MPHSSMSRSPQQQQQQKHPAAATTTHSNSNNNNNNNGMTTSNSPLHDDGQSGWRPRSDPIAIVRSTEESRHHQQQQHVVLDSSDDDDDDDDDELDHDDNDADEVSRVNVEMDALKLRTQGLLVGSMPVLPTNRSWRDEYHPSHHHHHQQHQQPPPAPLLRAIPGSQGRRSDLVPPMALTGGETKIVQSYGSLRESQMNGRFLDGPSSYRDVRAGGRLVPSKGIADRLVTVPTSSHNNNRMNNDTKRPSSSTLSAILQKDTSPSLSPCITNPNAYLESLRNNNNNNTQSNSEHHRYHQEQQQQRFESTDSNTSMLSTSLTGLEILQTARMQQLSLEPLQLSSSIREPGDLAPFHSRSLSFPAGSLLPPASPSTAVYRSNSFERPDYPLTTTTSTTNATTQHQQQQQMPFHNEDYERNNNPDTEGTFELDFDE